MRHSAFESRLRWLADENITQQAALDLHDFMQIHLPSARTAFMMQSNNHLSGTYGLQHAALVESRMAKLLPRAVMHLFTTTFAMHGQRQANR